MNLKEKYEKPMMKVELFSLSQTVAYDCGASHDAFLGYATQGSKTTCGWKDTDGEIAWLVSNTNCTIKYSESGEVAGFCYNAPSAGTSIFGSF